MVEWWTPAFEAREGWEAGPESEGPPKMRAVLRSLARAKGLLPPIEKGVRLRAFNEAQRRTCRPTGPIFDVPCRIVN